jgi:hypothetical protein
MTEKEPDMKIKTKPAVFTADRIAGDMLMLTLQAVAVGAAAAMAAGLIVAGMMAFLA